MGADLVWQGEVSARARAVEWTRPWAVRASSGKWLAAVSEPLAILLLPAKLEEFELAAQARELLAIPRVLALEPGRLRTPRLLRDSAAARGVRRLRLPGNPRVVVLYHPRQYPLARALLARYEEAELWYVRPDPERFGADPRERLDEFDLLARERATEARVFTAPDDELRRQLDLRFREVGIISSRPFLPGTRVS